VRQKADSTGGRGAPPGKPASFDLGAALRTDFELALAQLDAERLRTFLRSIDEAASGDAESSLAFALLEFAARELPGALLSAEDPELEPDTDRWARIASARPKPDLAECARLLSRARRQLLSGRHEVAKRCYEIVLTALAEIQVARGDVHILAPALVRPVVFGSYLTAVYEASEPESRASEVLEAVVRLSMVGPISSPLALMESASPRALEDLAAFTIDWANLLETHSEATDRVVVDVWTPSQALLAEALERLEGIDGIAKIARRSRDLAHFRTWMLRLADTHAWDMALDVVEEADGALDDPLGRALILDAGVVLAARASDRTRAAELAERALAAHPTHDRLIRFLLLDEPDRDVLRARALRLDDGALDVSARMRCLLHALLGRFVNVAMLLEESSAAWEDAEHAAEIAFPALLLAFYGGKKGTPTSSKLCSSLFTPRAPDATVTDLVGRLLEDGSTLSIPPVGPPILAALTEVEGTPEHVAVLDAIPIVLRASAARRASFVMPTSERASHERAALLVVAAAEATFRSGDPDGARAFVGEIAQEASRNMAFRSVLARTLGKSALVNAL